MRYRIGEDPNVADYGSTEGMLVVSAVLGLLIGITLVWAGVKGRQIWLVVWCGGLVVASLAYLGWAVYLAG